uniref:Ribosomal protein n=1 Tax=Paramormyrops kingsleyae TaxID=1676925 RepID=A0A3B3QQN5_9TELE
MSLIRVFSSLTRQVWYNLPRYRLSGSLPQTALHRCLSSISRMGVSAALVSMPRWLGPCQQLACWQQVAGMKTRTSLKRRCKDCFFVRRRGRLFVFCKTNPRHKQRQG